MGYKGGKARDIDLRNEARGCYPHLKLALTRSIDWILIRQENDGLVKYATPIEFGTAEGGTILARFTRQAIHPT